ncbi:helix-turn-helix domain-containing protein [Salmonella enterica]|uniref:helix-turn-helix domain-containing protein n=1 Tax=Salmonella enterica TaxID=28901 RepID=UPI003735BBD0
MSQEKDIKNHIGLRLREERERLGLSQPALGKIGGVTKLTQLNYEKGKGMPDAAYLYTIHKALGINIHYILTGIRTPDITAKSSTVINQGPETPQAGDSTSGEIAILLRRANEEDKERLLNALCEIGIKGILNKLQQSDTSPQATQTTTPPVQPGRELTIEEIKAMIMSLPVRDSLKAAFARGLHANKEADQEILRILESHERAPSPDGDSVPSVTPDSALKQKNG